MDSIPPDLVTLLAGELDAARRQLEEIAVQLCIDPVVSQRHSARLQSFDHVAQVMGEIAGVLRFAGPPGDAVGAIRLDAMRDRLAAAA